MSRKIRIDRAVVVGKLGRKNNTTGDCQQDKYNSNRQLVLTKVHWRRLSLVFFVGIEGVDVLISNKRGQSKSRKAQSHYVNICVLAIPGGQNAKKIWRQINCLLGNSK